MDRCVFLLAVGLATAGCSPPPLDIPDGCNPLAASPECLLPFPSDVFRVDDPTLPSGHRVAHSQAALPHTDDGESVDPTFLHPADGFSHFTQILVLFPGGVDDANLVFHTGDVTDSLGDSSPTVLVTADTGERILHFAELDPRVTDPQRQALIIRPLVRLDNSTRYVVGLRGLLRPDGSEVPAPEGFRRIRDRQTGGDPILAPLAARYKEEIFPVLERAGVARKTLQLAWDFTTTTQENVVRDMMTIRDDVIALLAATPPAVTIQQVTDDVDVNIFRKIEGTIRVPLFMEHSQAGALLFRDSAGHVAANGTTEVPFMLLIPRSVAEGLSPRRPARLLQFGHGFFGSRDEIEGDFVAPFVERTGMVVLAVDWWGMSRDDLVIIAGDLAGDLSMAIRFTDRVHQGMANQIALAHAAKTTLPEVPELTIGGELVYDPSEIYYYGISNGHILGGTYLALTPHVSRAVLSVGGAGLSLMMFRSRSFGPLVALIDIQMSGRLEQQKLVAMLQPGLDRIDPITYAQYVLDEPLPGAPSERRVLLQIGIGDTSMPNLASHVHARALGISHLTPAPRVIAALPTAEAPHDGSALIELDFGVPSPPPGTYAIIPSEDNEVHEAVRRTDSGIEQIDAFLQPGAPIRNFCNGPCDPE